MATKSTFDVLTATVHELRDLLDAGKFTSVELVKAHLSQISRHDRAGMKLNAIISIAPEKELFEEANALDQERIKFGTRSKLHGIPIIIKVLLYERLTRSILIQERRMSYVPPPSRCRQPQKASH